jgi:uncharacterized protein
LLGHSKIVSRLVNAGSGINVSSKDGLTPLVCAAVKGHGDIIVLLLEAGVDFGVA